MSQTEQRPDITLDQQVALNTAAVRPVRDAIEVRVRQLLEELSVPVRPR